MQLSLQRNVFPLLSLSPSFLCMCPLCLVSGVPATDHRGRVSAVVGCQRDAEGEKTPGLHWQKWEDKACGQNPEGKMMWCPTGCMKCFFSYWEYLCSLAVPLREDRGHQRGSLWSLTSSRNRWCYITTGGRRSSRWGEAEESCFLFVLTVHFWLSSACQPFFRNWRRQTMTATWTQSGQTDRPWKNSSKDSPTSNGGRGEAHYQSGISWDALSSTSKATSDVVYVYF